VKNAVLGNVVLVYHQSVNEFPLADGKGTAQLSDMDALYAKLFYGEKSRDIYLQSGDDMTVTFDANDFDNTFAVKGGNEKAIDYLGKMQLVNLPDESYAMSWPEFKKAIDSKMASVKRLLKVRKFAKDEKFQKMEEGRITYFYANAFLMYPVSHLYLTRDTTMVLDDDYYDTLRSYVKEDEDLVDIDEYRNYMIETSHVLDEAGKDIRQYYPKVLAEMNYIGEHFGESYVPKTPRVYRAGKGSQDAHEAIRPSDINISPAQVKEVLTADQYKLYKLIWERFTASQMASAVYDTMTVECTAAGHVFRASAYSIRFRGFLAASDTAGDDAPAEGDVCVRTIPVLTEGEELTLLDVARDCHFTEPPPRYNDASLIKMFEETGIGRPSTYSTIITTILARDYVRRDGRSLVPTQLGCITTEMMKEYFPDIVDVKFTAHMEDSLDNIEHGGSTCAEVLGDFYTMFDKELKNAEEKTDKEKIEVPAEESEYVCEKCGSKMVYKTGRYGRFLACPNYPACRNTKAVDKNGVPVKREETQPELAGFKCELCGADMLVRHGRYGTFYACSNYPTCRFTKQKTNEIGVACPDCGAKIITKFSRAHKLFYSCERYPECGFSSWDLPLAEKCPLCGDCLLYKKSKKQVYCRNKDCTYTREEEIGSGEEN